MISAKRLAAAYFLDCVVGDPEWMPHPVRIIGSGTQAGERFLRGFSNSRCYEIVSGGALALGLTIGSSLLTRSLLRGVSRRRRWLGVTVEIALASSCLAAKNLLDETNAVLRALEKGDLPLARQRLSRIVGRDTAMLNEAEVCRAVIETLAESLSDGVIAPLFYLAVGGVPLAMAYKAVNTLDSMIGYKDDRYLHFGRVAAQLDDAANYLPSRLTALLICGATLFSEPRALPSAVSAWKNDGRKHASPNAGQPESAMAGALQVRLGGTNTYHGEAVHSPLMGEPFPAPDLRAARRARGYAAFASLLGLGAAILFVRALRND